MTDLDLFRTIGAALYGSQWHGDMSRLLGVNVRNIERWAKGQSRIPDGIWADLQPLLAEKQAELTRLTPVLEDRASKSTPD